jgi:hypothetical protein
MFREINETEFKTINVMIKVRVSHPDVFKDRIKTLKTAKHNLFNYSSC